MRKWIRRRDIFATPVHHTYRGAHNFKTGLGGLCSIILIAAAIIYFVVNAFEKGLRPNFRESQTSKYLAREDQTDYIIPTATNNVAGHLLGTDASKYMRI